LALLITCKVTIKSSTHCRFPFSWLLFRIFEFLYSIIYVF
ncbi:unnamed protein product, partial [Brassica oleracea]